MSKMSELALAVKELKRCGEALIGISETLADLFSGNNTEDAGLPETLDKEKKAVTLEAVRAVLADKSRMGFTAEVRSLLIKHGATKLSDIDPSKYPALLTEAEVLGNG